MSGDQVARKRTEILAGRPVTEDDSARPAIEQFEYDERQNRFVRTVKTSDGDFVRSAIPSCYSESPTKANLAADYDAAWLRATKLPRFWPRREPIRVVDLFSGCGAMMLGAAEAARALRARIEPTLAVDLDSTALAVLARNFPQADCRNEDVASLIGTDTGTDVAERRSRLKEDVGQVDLLLGGPPCQGHSNLNNSSRRKDPKNSLFFAMATAAELLEPRHVILENVRDVVHDQDAVFQRTYDHLARLGYSVDAGLLKAEDLGVAQRRHRMFLVASRQHAVDIGRMVAPFTARRRSFDWACADLDDTPADGAFDAASQPTAVTRGRIDWLFENRKYELPNSLRPACHHAGEHSYLSVYGRIRPDEPVQTITTGFTYMGQGRFVHPRRRRTITPHEAARLQFLPDHFVFGDLSRRAYKSMIGNAVPPKLVYILALQLLR